MTASPRLLVSANTAWYVVNFRAGLVRALQADGYAVTAIAPHGDGWERLGDLGVERIALAMDAKGTHPLRDYASYRAYVSAMRSIRPIGYLGFTIKPVVYGGFAARRLGIPYASTVTGLGTAFIAGGWLQRVAQQLYRASQRAADRVLFQNPTDRELFVERGLVDASRTGLLPGSGIDVDRFRVQPLPSRRAGEGVFVLPARLLGDKGVREFVAAATRLKPQWPAARFQLLGACDVDNRSAIGAAEIARWHDDGAIEYLGNVDDVRPAIAAADGVVLPSYREGLPRALLEGAAMGRLLVATDVPGCRDVVRHGETGWLCAPRDAGALADAMERVLRMTPEERAAMGARARADVENRFDERIVVQAYRDIVAAWKTSSRS